MDERPQQAPAFEDGTVTFDEYEAAILRVVACVRGQGVQITDPQLENGFFEYEFGFAATDEAAEAAVAVHDGCYRTHADAIADIYAVSEYDPAIERAYLAEYRSCMLEGGFDVDPEQPIDLGSLASDENRASRHFECTARAEAAS